MISFKNTGNFSKTIKFLNKKSSLDIIRSLGRFGEEGVSALEKSTPVDSGLTKQAWSYKITNTKGGIKISWFNSNVVDGVPIAILLQYGHGTQNGGWVEGRDYINPAIRPVFDKISDKAWQEVIR